MIDILPRVKRFAKLVPLVLLAVLAGACAGTLTAGAAVVNGVSISRETLDAQVAATAAGQPGGDATQTARQVLEELIQQELLRQVAATRGVKVSEARVREQFEQIKAQSGPQFADQLKQAGLTEESLRERIRLNEMVQALGEKIGPKISDAELRTVYDAEKEQFRQVSARDILIAVDEKTTEERAKLRAEAALRDLRTGTSFSSLAKKISDDRATAATGGSLGPWLSLAQVDTAFAEAMWSAKLGRPSGPVRDQRGFHVFVVSKRRYEPFSAVRGQLREELEQRTRQTELQKLLAAEGGSARVVVNPRYGDWDAETGRIVPHESFVPAEPAEPLAPTPGLPDPFGGAPPGS